MNNKILLHPYAARLPEYQQVNPKNYHRWPEVVAQLNAAGYEVVQVGVKGEARVEGVGQFIVGWPLNRLHEIVAACASWVAVDSFFPHFVHVECGGKPGVVVWGQSNPDHWGHPQNINLLKDRRYLREWQFQSWWAAQFNPEAFVEPHVVVEAVINLAPLPLAVSAKKSPHVGTY